MKAVLTWIISGYLHRGLGISEKISLGKLFRDKPIIAWLLVTAILAVVYFRLAEPLYLYLADAEKETAQLNRAVENEKLLLDKAEEKLSTLKKAHEALLASTMQSANSGTEQALINLIRNAAQSHNLSQIQVTPLPSQSTNKLLKRLLKMEATGSQAQLISFIQGFANKSNKLFITEVELAPTALPHVGNLSARIMIAAFQKEGAPQ